MHENKALKTPLIRTFLCTAFALIAFSANSVLCRLALKGGQIDPSSFTVIRLLSGVLVLVVIIKLSSIPSGQQSRGSWIAAFMLFLYATTFSFAYITLDTGTGALVLFGAVQITMLLIGFFRGNRLSVVEWIGMAIAFAGLIYLVLPDVTTPSLAGFLLMTLAGIAWGIYTLIGRGSSNPLADTTYNFVRTIPFVLFLALAAMAYGRVSMEGILLALISGGVASGIGYTIWYTALRGLSATEAAVVQLAVPVIAAFGGVIFVSELITLRLLISAALTLGGIMMVTLGQHYFAVYRQRPNR